jgi:Cu(I)/Ag(I) efflux system membrane protein CusA/SilA
MHDPCQLARSPELAALSWEAEAARARAVALRRPMDPQLMVGVEALGAMPDAADPTMGMVGQYEFLERAQGRMAVMVPLTVGLVFLLTWMAFRTVGETALVLVTLPFSVLGSIWFLALAGYHLSIAVWVAMVALVGVGAETGTVLAVYLDLGVKEALARGEVLTPERLAEVAADSAASRMRGMVLAIAMNLIGLVPVLFSSGVGSDLTRRMAGPMFGGLLTLAFMTSLALPALWTLWRTRQLRNGTLESSLSRSRAEA